MAHKHLLYRLDARDKVLRGAAERTRDAAGDGNG